MTKNKNETKNDGMLKNLNENGSKEVGKKSGNTINVKIKDIKQMTIAGIMERKAIRLKTKMEETDPNNTNSATTNIKQNAKEASTSTRITHKRKNINKFKKKVPPISPSANKITNFFHNQSVAELSNNEEKNLTKYGRRVNNG